MKKLPLTVLLAVPVIANGQTTFSETQSFGSEILSFTDVLTFNQFNGDLADLVDIQVCFDLDVDGGQLIVDNDGSLPATLDASIGATLEVTSNDVMFLDAGFVSIFSDVASATTQTFDLAANVGDATNDFDPTGPDGTTLVGQPSNSNGGGSVNSIFWSDYIGAGTFDFDVAADVLATITAAGGVELARTPGTASGSITVKYITNTPAVPEPSTALMSVVGLLGLIARRRR